MQNIGCRLREVREAVREERGLRLFGGRPWVAEIEDATGYAVSAPTASAYESSDGTDKIPAQYVAAVCETFNVDPRWLLLGQGAMRPLGESRKAQGYDAIRAVVQAVESLEELPVLIFDPTKPDAMREALARHAAIVEEAERRQAGGGA